MKQSSIIIFEVVDLLILYFHAENKMLFNTLNTLYLSHFLAYNIKYQKIQSTTLRQHHYYYQLYAIIQKHGVYCIAAWKC